jgi:hypothetical protein
VIAALILAAALHATPVEAVEARVLAAIYSAQGARAERATVAAWLDAQDSILEAHRRGRKRAPDIAELVVEPAQTSPFAPSDDFDPFVDSTDDRAAKW